MNLLRLMGAATTGNGSRVLFYRVCLHQAGIGRKDVTLYSSTLLIVTHALLAGHEFDNSELNQVYNGHFLSSTCTDEWHATDVS